MKNYFYAYINHIQDDWVDNLSMAEFAASNFVNILTVVILFFADYEFHSQAGIKLPETYSDSKRRGKLLVTNKIVKK